MSSQSMYDAHNKIYFNPAFKHEEITERLKQTVEEYALVAQDTTTLLYRMIDRATPDAQAKAIRYIQSHFNLYEAMFRFEEILRTDEELTPQDRILNMLKTVVNEVGHPMKMLSTPSMFIEKQKPHERAPKTHIQFVIEFDRNSDAALDLEEDLWAEAFEYSEPDITIKNLYDNVHMVSMHVYLMILKDEVTTNE